MERVVAQSATGQGYSQHYRVQDLLGASEDKLRDYTGGVTVEGTL